MIALPLLTEEASLVQQSIDRDINLKLSRRDSTFNGCWVTLSRKGEPIIIERKRGQLSIKPFNTELYGLPKNQGLNQPGKSLLCKSLKLCKQPGSLIRSLKAMQIELTQTRTADINWDTWFEHHFKDDQQTRKKNKEATMSLDKLRALIKRASIYEPAFADVVMLGQLIDCRESLGFEIELQSTN